ncbi:hypothetical protein Ciccas_010279 [Cichlidogyrus casuarinus]|uniref:Endonuclease/exonuclease/phosphatase domain-containing protein n=1 Tax=Cichlidogyrus casuarinus TaxID=1844966 RepID=A0ABD2PUL3_9PLAT
MEDLVVLTTVYLPPQLSSDTLQLALEQLETHIQMAEELSLDIIIVGDFNLARVNWNTPTT